MERKLHHILPGTGRRRVASRVHFGATGFPGREFDLRWLRKVDSNFKRSVGVSYLDPKQSPCWYSKFGCATSSKLEIVRKSFAKISKHTPNLFAFLCIFVGLAPCCCIQNSTELKRLSLRWKLLGKYSFTALFLRHFTIFPSSSQFYFCF